MADVICLDDLDRFGGELNDPLAELAQDNYHRLIESPGSNPDDPDRGLGLDDMLSGAIGTGIADASDLTLLGPRIETELLKDVRNAEVKVTVRVTSEGHAGTSLDVAIEIVTDKNELLKLGLTADSDGVRRTT